MEMICRSRIEPEKKSSLWLAIALFLLFIGQIYGQGRCELVSQECLDMTAISAGSGTIEVPSNTTRLSAEGISICLTPVGTLTPPTDVIFVVDRSGSMCCDTGDKDINNYAPVATENSIQILYDNSPSSTAGIIQFNSSIINPEYSPLQLDVADNLATMKTNALALVNADGGTNYVDPLERANTLATVNGLYPKDAIIFITDGVPSGNGFPTTNLGKYNEWIDAGIDIAPVYCIFIGGDYTDTSDVNSPAGRLLNLAKLTGGGYFPVEANNPLQLATVMEAVVIQAISPGIPSQTTIENTSIGQTSVADSLDHTDQGNGLYQVSLDSIIGLIPNSTNQLIVTSISVKNGVVRDTAVFNLTINTTGPATSAMGSGINLPDSLFDIDCSPLSVLQFTDNSFTPIQTLGFPFPPNFGLELLSYSNVSSATIDLISTATGDRETFTITRGGINDSIYSGLVSFLNQVTATAYNSLAEEAAGGSFIANWVHPRDSQDSTSDTLTINPKVEIPEVTLTGGTPAGSSTFVSSITNLLFTATPDPVTIYYTLDGSTPNTSSLVFDPLNPFILINTTTVKAIATKTGWIDSDVLTYTVTRTATGSSISLLENSLGNFPNNTVASDVTKYALQLSTNYGGSATLNPGIKSISSGDSVTLSLVSEDITGSNGTYARIYTKTNLSLAIGSAVVANNSTLETNEFDTLVVTWINPLDASDVVKDTLYTQPANDTAKIFFSTTSSLSNVVTSFNESNSTIFVIVTDQTPHPDSTYTVSLVSGGDNETVTLSLVAGNLVGSLTLSYDTIATGDGKLQATLPGDAILANYRDPFYSSGLTQASVNIDAKSIADPAVTDTLAASITTGVYFTSDTTIRITVSTPGAKIRFDTTGSITPSNTVGELYTPGSNILITNSTTLRIIAYLENDTVNNFVPSNLVQVSLNNRDNVGLPHAEPTGTFFTGSIVVLLVADSSTDSILYRLDGTNPGTSTGGGTFYYDTNLTSFNFTENTVLKFRAINPNKNATGVITEVYTKRIDLAPPPLPHQLAAQCSLAMCLSL